MQVPPTLTPGAKRVLEVIVRNNTIDGSTLVKQLGIGRRQEIVESIRELESFDLIEVGGPITVEELPFARFGVRPSAREYLARMLKSLK